MSGLSVRTSEGSYEFRDGDGIVPLLLRPLGRPGGCSATAANFLAGEVLSRMEAFDFRSNAEHGRIAERVGAMLSGGPASGWFIGLGSCFTTRLGQNLRLRGI